ncbi:MAG: hypothetical protein PVSMB2_22140 [Ktedonobacteraceae bacterium]
MKSHRSLRGKRSTFLLRQTMNVSLIGVVAFCLINCGGSSSQGFTSTATRQIVCSLQQLSACHILVFSKTGAFRHASISDALVALRRRAVSQHVTIDASEDASVFTDVNLSHYNAVVFLLTTGKILDASQKAAFERYIQRGGGYAGVHSASDTEYDWSWYGQLVGAYFDRVHGHSRVVQARVHVLDTTHSSTQMLPAFWVRTDEWYNFAANPRRTVHVLMIVDEKTYSGGVMGTDHPIAWYHAFDGGRSWYTAMGHTSESYKEPLFLAHLWGGILYAAGVDV